MKRFGKHSLLSFGAGLFLLVVGLAPTARPAFAQDDDDKALAAAKKAATFFEMTGMGHVKPSAYFLRVEVEAEGNNIAALRESAQRSAQNVITALTATGLHPGSVQDARLLVRTPGTNSWGFTQNNVTQASFKDSDTLKAVNSVGVRVDVTKVPATLAALRSTGARGTVTLSCLLDNEEVARRAALQDAVASANERVKILNAAAAPQQFALIFLKQGDFEVLDNRTTSVALQSGDPLPLMDTVDARASVVLFYGFKSPTSVAPATTKAIPAKAGAAKSSSQKTGIVKP